MSLKKAIYNIHTLDNINLITKTQRNQINISYLIKINPIEQLSGNIKEVVSVPEHRKLFQQYHLLSFSETLLAIY